MISPYCLAVATVVIPLARSHFTFNRIAVNDEWQTPVRFFRNKTTPFEGENTAPNTNVITRIFNEPTYLSDLAESIRCGRDNMAWAANTETLTVTAGDTLEIAHNRRSPNEWKDEQWYNCFDGRGSCDPPYHMDINHPGPFLAFLSKVPEGQDVTTYDGSGSWTKIYTLGLDLSNISPGIHWPYNGNSMSAGGQLPERLRFKIPAQTPPGQYLLRLDLIWASINGTAEFPGSDYPNTTQMYPSCAQLLIKSNATGSLPPGIKIPEAFQPDSPGMVTSLAMYREQKLDANYEYPGGLRWDGKKLNVDKPGI